MLLLDFNWLHLINPEFYIQLGGYWLVLFIIFAETGLFLGFFLPGDSLLFIAGIYSQRLVEESLFMFNNESLNLIEAVLFISIAAILGNLLGYTIGKHSGESIYKKKDNWLFKKKYLYQAHDFYEKHGVMAILLGRFLPIVRTFSPVIAGIVKMDFRKFIVLSIVGGFIWILSMMAIGHYLNAIFLTQFGIDLRKHLEWIVIGIVLITTVPIFYKIIFHKQEKQTTF
ncbi:MAG: DedA family protein [Chitinophagaceae bacterium]